jgi:hypothetical protein
MRYGLVTLVILALAALPAGAQAPADDTQPVVTCAGDDGSWHASNVTIGCTAADPETDIPDPADQAFNLGTSVAPGVETSNASTDSREVCNGDASPDCVLAGPISGIKVDQHEPDNPAQIRSSDHIVGKWSRDRSIAMTFTSGVDGGSGVDGFSRAWTRIDGFDPDTIKDLEQGARSATSARLGNGRWYFHIRTRDNVGNWGFTAQRGPYLIDFARPSARALSGTGKTGKSLRLRYRTADNNHRTREKVTISRGGSTLRTWNRGMAAASWSNVQSILWTPASAGQFSLCVRAWDPAGNNRHDCAAISVTNPAPPPSRCDPSYPTVCIPSPPPDLDCADVRFQDFVVRQPDPHGFDGDHDGRGCES